MKKMKSFLVLILAVAICLSAFVGCDLGNEEKEEKDNNADKTVISTDNVSVSSKMMTFFMNDKIMNWYAQYGGYSSLFSIDLSQDLRSQQYGVGYESMFLGEFSGTWYDYFLSTTLEEVKMYVIYAEAAKAAGVTLTEQDKADIDATISDIKESLKAKNTSFSNQYGKGVDESVVCECYELIYLASTFADYKQEQIEDALDKDDSALHQYVKDHKEEFYSAKCLKYSATIKEQSFKNAEEYQKQVDKKKALAERMVNAKNAEEFVMLMEGKNSGYETYTYSAEELESKIEKYSVIIEYAEGGDLNDFLFGDEWASEGEVYIEQRDGTEIVTEKIISADEKVDTVEGEVNAADDLIEFDSSLVAFKPGSSIITIFPGQSNIVSMETVGEGVIIFPGSSFATQSTNASDECEAETSSDKTEDESANVVTRIYKTFTIEAYYVIDSCDLNREFVHNFAYLVVDDEAVAKAFKEEFFKGEKTLDKFYALAESKHDSTHGEGEHDHSDKTFEFNKFEKQASGAFNETYDALNKWIEDDDRKAGDISDVIKVSTTDSNNKTSYTYAILFFDKDFSEEKEKGQTWYINAYYATVNDMWDKWYEDCKNEMHINMDQKALNNINIVKILNPTE